MRYHLMRASVRRLAVVTLVAGTIGWIAGCSTRAPTAGVVRDLPGTASSLPDFERRLDSLRALLHVPGMAGAISRNGHVVWSHAFGYADLAQRTPTSTTTTFHLASLTKAFAATVLLRLVDSGLVALDDPVAKFGITLANPGGPILVRHLLSMTSGGSAPGATFAYDGNRFALLGQVIFSASGRSFADLATAWVIRPLGLTRTAPNVADPASFAFSGLDSVTYAASMALPYTLQDGHVVATAYPRTFGAAAGMISSAEDVLAFNAALDDSRVLRAPLRDLMFTPVVSTSGTTLPYAFGWFAQRERDFRLQWAYGLWTGNSSLLIRAPDLGLTFVLLSNSDQLSASYPLGAGRLLDSPMANEFLNAFVFSSAVVIP